MKVIRKLLKRIIGISAAIMIMCSYAVGNHLNADIEKINIRESDVLTSTEIDLTAYQIKMETRTVHCDNVAFRVIFKVPNIGNEISANGETYTVANVGIIYALDDNDSGYDSCNMLNADYTILDAGTFTESNTGNYYIGLNQYNCENRTFGFLSSEIGVKQDYREEDVEHTYYVRTMTHMDELLASTIHMRAFVVATDGTIIYEEEEHTTSIAKIADTLYSGGQIPEEISFNYLYDKILHSPILKEVWEKYDYKYPYYYEKPEEFGWSPVVKP